MQTQGIIVNHKDPGCYLYLAFKQCVNYLCQSHKCMY